MFLVAHQEPVRQHVLQKYLVVSVVLMAVLSWLHCVFLPMHCLAHSERESYPTHSLAEFPVAVVAVVAAILVAQEE